MCEFCVKHGEGKKWYLNVKNYSLDLLSDIKRKKIIKEFFYWIDGVYKFGYKPLRFLSTHLPASKPLIRAIIKRMFVHRKWGQVIPIEDVKEVLSFTNSIVRVPCICQKVVKGNEVRKCLLISLDPKSTGLADTIDQSFFGGPDVAKFEKIDKVKALDFMKQTEEQGGFHSIYTFRTPFIGAICNCDEKSCLPLKMVHEKMGTLFFRSEYVTKIDKDKCVGCMACIEICPFGALKYDAINKKAYVDYEKCYGCGTCRAVCTQGAHSLQERRLVNKTANLW